ncbi:hypothetical protein ACTXT7_009875 [Hymenolepis weldensis]
MHETTWCSLNRFEQGTHAEFIEHLMRLCMKKLAPFPLLEREIQQLAKGSLELASAINLSSLQQVDANSPDFVELYGRLLHAWLLAIAWITVPDLTQNLRPEGVHSDEIIQNLGLISLLSCASYYYRSQIATLLPPSSRSTLIKDTQLAALIERNEPMRRTACLKDDQSNAPRLFAILGGILEQKKVTGGRPEPPHISLITAALCALPHFVGSGEETFSNISALCSSAALFHWFTGSGWPQSTANQLAADEPRLATQKTPSSNQTALRNSGKAIGINWSLPEYDLKHKMLTHPIVSTIFEPLPCTNPKLREQSCNQAPINMVKFQAVFVYLIADQFFLQSKVIMAHAIFKYGTVIEKANDLI